MRKKESSTKPEFDPVTDQIGRWNLRAFPSVSACVEKVLRTMAMDGVYELRDKKFQIAVTDRGLVWAHFPMHKARLIARDEKVTLQPGVKVLLVIPHEEVDSRPRKATLAEIAHHFGHVLCYLRKPRWIHDCTDADHEARDIGLGKLLAKERPANDR